MSNETKAAPAVPQGLPAFDELDDEVVDAACTVGSLYRVDLMFAYERIRAMLAATPATLAAPSQEPGKCAQCKKPYRKGANTEGCPKCAPGVVVPESEFQKPISALSEKQAKATP